MKKLLFSLALLTSFGSVNAQLLTYDFTAKYAQSATGMFNKSISDLGASQDYDIAFSGNYGIGASINYGQVGLGLEFLMGNFKAGYQGDQAILGGAYTSSVNIKTTQVPVYLRFGGAEGSFSEIGIVMHQIKGAEYSNSANYQNDVTGAYQNFMGYMIGFGNRINLGDLPVMLTISTRFMYSTADAKGVDALGANLELYNNNNKTNAASVGLHVGVVYSID